MLRSILDKLAVLGRSGMLLAATAMLLLFGSVMPFTVRQITWLVQSERIVEEMEDPVILDWTDANLVEPIRRYAWSAGQTMYVERSVCVYQRVTGQIERSIVDTAHIDLGAVPLAGLLDLDVSAYDDTGRLKRPPWCGQDGRGAKRISAITIPAFMAPGPASLASKIDAYLNPLKPHVFVPLRPASFLVESTPLVSEIETTRERTRDLRSALDVRTNLLGLKLDALRDRLRDMERGLERMESYHRQLDAHLRAQRVLPPAPAGKP